MGHFSVINTLLPGQLSVRINNLIERTKIPAPQMPPIRVDPAIAANSLRVIEATQVAESANAGPAKPGATPAPEAVGAGGAPTKARRSLNQAAIDECLAASLKQQVKKLFENVVALNEKAV